MIATVICATAAATATATVIHVPADEPTIQDAIDAAVVADVILIAPGAYDELIDFLGKDIVVRSTGGPSVTTISAPLAGTSVVSFVGGETPAAVLQGFTISGGSAPDGGGMRIISSSTTGRLTPRKRLLTGCLWSAAE